ncbi:response regulator [Paraneptunicella aestuarii]|uniref:response regulator n=1 Tax=Paraneptunicella aestuarii TaxID=2831148 RepID=UPI001E484597|nr:response regulator [Paraneptunicella aestuarii]UAA39771.1 response regulator [Paraneptunicella aestuarii]
MQYQVLICDDSKLGRRTVNRCLPDGFAGEIHMASNGQEALDVLRAHAIDVLFLDLTMPVMDGVEVLEYILKEKIPVSVIVVSGDVQPQMQQRVIELGALEFIPKPLQAQQLVDTLQRWELLK